MAKFNHNSHFQLFIFFPLHLAAAAAAVISQFSTSLIYLKNTKIKKKYSREISAAQNVDKHNSF
jgi:hypothetical protein